MTQELVTMPQSGVETYRLSTDAAGLSKAIVLQTAVEIQGRKYVKVEGWQAIAIAHGCAASAEKVARIEGGVTAVGQVRRMDTGIVIAEAEGFVGEDEPVWFGGEGKDRYGKPKTFPKRPDYAIRAMAQTRAISRACRSAFALVVVMIDKNLSTTPAEEMMGLPENQRAGGGDDWKDITREAQESGLGMPAGETSTYDANKATKAKTYADDLITVLNTATKDEARKVWTENWKAPAGKKVSPLAWLELHAPDQFQRVSQAHENAVA